MATPSSAIEARRDGIAAVRPPRERESAVGDEAEDDGRLRCAACGHPVTHERARAAVDGAHVHRRINPFGVAFRFGCFTRADGVRVIGGETTDHTWFAGHAWSIVVCGGCGEHLGWRFATADGERFFALILDRLCTERPA